MLVTKFEDVLGTDREVFCPNAGFISYRFLLKSDGMGFSLNVTKVPKGSPQHWHYRNHLEACYCVRGRGELVNLETDEVHIIEEGSLYALDNHDDHMFQALEDTTLISVFNPPLTGLEVHNKEGHYD